MREQTNGSYENIVRLKGKKISLCAFRTDDEAISQYLHWINDETINFWIDAGNKVYDFNREKEFCEGALKDPNNLKFNIVDNETNQLIGNCDISVKDCHRRASFGILIGEHDYLSKGCGAEAVSLMVKFCFENLNIHTIYLQTMSENKRAIRCYEKVGFRQCGIDHDAVYINGHYSDVCRMELLEADYWSQRNISDLGTGIVNEYLKTI